MSYRKKLSQMQKNNVLSGRKKINYRHLADIICLCFIFSGCASTNISGNGATVTEIRDGISELERQEYEALRIKYGLEITSQEFDRVIDSQAEHYRNIDELLQRIREQVISGTPATSGADAEIERTEIKD